LHTTTCTRLCAIKIKVYGDIIDGHPAATPFLHARDYCALALAAPTGFAALSATLLYTDALAGTPEPATQHD
jgi:hypothetical protein